MKYVLLVYLLCIISSSSIIVDIDMDHSVKLRDQFYSVTIDAGQIARGASFWNVSTRFDWKRPKLLRLAKELSPAYLRIGGTAADGVYFDREDKIAFAPYPYSTLLKTEDIDDMCRFVDEVGYELIFGINGAVGPRYRQPHNRWTADNAIQIMSYMKDINCSVAGFEFSNEPNLFIFNFGSYISGSDLAIDFVLFKSSIESVFHGSKVPLAIAPDVAFQIPFFGELFYDYLLHFLDKVDSIDAISWHWYPFQAERCIEFLPWLKYIDPWFATPERVLETRNLDEIDSSLNSVISWRNKKSPSAEMWMGESSSASCGGEIGVSDSFVDGIWWFDQLGKLAQNNHQIVARQVLSGGTYGLLEDSNLFPRPDYFSSVLWKKLFGNVAFQTSSYSSEIRFYAHCHPEDGVSILVINLSQKKQSVELKNQPSTQYQREEYRFTGESLTSKTMMLNGHNLMLDNNGNLPSMKPDILESFPIVVEPLSYNFYVLKNITSPCTIRM